MTLFAVPIIAVLALISSLVIGILFWVKNSKLQRQCSDFSTKIQINDLLINETKAALDKQQLYIEKLSHDQQLKTTETDQVVKQLEHRIQAVQQQLSKNQETLQHCLDQQPEDKFYSRAYKLAAMGAGLDEIMQECELPRAEAEMLLAVYKKK